MPIFVAVWRPFPENKQSIHLSTSTNDDSRSNHQELSTVCSCSKQLFSILWLFSRIGYHTSNILYLRLEDRDWEYETDVWLQSSIGIDPSLFFFVPVLVLLLHESVLNFSRAKRGSWRFFVTWTGSLGLHRKTKSSVVQPSVHDG